MIDKNEEEKQSNDKANAIALLVAIIVFALLF